jgi:hypothetical protein
LQMTVRNAWMSSRPPMTCKIISPPSRGFHRQFRG